jgi:SH3-like domain-containing protein
LDFPAAAAKERSMLRKFQFVWILVPFLLISQGVVFASQRMSVKSDTANIRAKPDLQSDTLWQVEKYYPLLILEKKGSWYRFKDFEGDVGWIHDSLVDNTPTVIVKVDRANIRADAGTQYDLVFDAQKGTPFKMLEKKGQWIRIQHADGDTGWVFSSLVW